MVTGRGVSLHSLQEGQVAADTNIQNNYWLLEVGEELAAGMRIEHTGPVKEVGMNTTSIEVEAVAEGESNIAEEVEQAYPLEPGSRSFVQDARLVERRP